VALLAGSAGFLAAELMSTPSGVRGAAAHSGDLALLFGGHGGKAAQAARLGSIGVLHCFAPVGVTMWQCLYKLSGACVGRSLLPVFKTADLAVQESA
jgi:hypothetical protein